MNIGQAIKLCRTRRGLSQAELARHAECSVSYLSMLENNKRDPTLSTMTQIAHALRVPVGIIFFLGAENGDLSGIDKTLQGDLARTALELLNEPVSDQRPLL
jgi:transcriptional regulator with XRE-family HTH domain